MNSTYDSTYSGPVDAGASAAFVLIELLFFAIYYVYYSYALSRIFNKMGIESWKAWVPIYRSWVFLEAGGQAGFWAILSFIPVVNIAAVIFMIFAANNIGKGFHKDAGYTVLYFFLPFVWVGILGFGQAQYDDGYLDQGNPYPANRYQPQNPYLNQQPPATQQPYNAPYGSTPPPPPAPYQYGNQNPPQPPTQSGPPSLSKDN
jgi:hypothetical protein